MRSKAFSASKQQINTGNSLLVKYVYTAFNAKIAWYCTHHVLKNLANYNAMLNLETKSDKHDLNNIRIDVMIISL